MKRHGKSQQLLKLREERLARHWSQQALADRLGTTVVTVNRWERGVSQPNSYFRLKLSELFGKSMRELGLVLDEDAVEDAVSFDQGKGEVHPDLVLVHWDVPYHRNPFFTGRKEVLERLHQVLCTERKVASTPAYALCGLGGIGKTQTALEYAYVYRDEYTAVLWMRAETRESLISDMMAFVHRNQLLEEDKHKRDRLIQATRRWLRDHANWLLILDNVEDFTILTDFIPTDHKGHLLLTTRTQFTGTVAECIYLEQMTEEESQLLLLRRAKLVASQTLGEFITEEMYIGAAKIVRLLDGLPLAIDQAGAYIEEAAYSLEEYLSLYQQQRASLLDRRGGIALDHPSSVVATIMLCMRQIERENPTAIRVLYLCAFLPSDNIPEELFLCSNCQCNGAVQGEHLDPLALSSALVVLRRYSLIRRHPETRTLSLHRLVQAVLKDQMDDQTQRSWAEQAVQAVNALFPEVERLTTWSQCQRYLPHALACIELIDQWHLTSSDAVRLLAQTSAYLRERAQETLANTLTDRFAAMHKQSIDASCPDVITDFFAFMRHAYYQGKYHVASVAIREQATFLERTTGIDHPFAVHTFHLWAQLHLTQGKLEQAEACCLQAVHISECVQGSNHPETADCLKTLADIFCLLDRRMEAESIYQRVLALDEKALGTLHPHYIATLECYTALRQAAIKTAIPVSSFSTPPILDQLQQ